MFESLKATEAPPARDLKKPRSKNKIQIASEDPRSWRETFPPAPVNQASLAQKPTKIWSRVIIDYDATLNLLIPGFQIATVQRNHAET